MLPLLLILISILLLHFADLGVLASLDLAHSHQLVVVLLLLSTLVALFATFATLTLVLLLLLSAFAVLLLGLLLFAILPSTTVSYILTSLLSDLDDCDLLVIFIATE